MLVHASLGDEAEAEVRLAVRDRAQSPLVHCCCWDCCSNWKPMAVEAGAWEAMIAGMNPW